MFEFTKLGDIATLTVGYVGNMTQEYTESGVPFLRSLNIKPFHISESDIRYISEAFNMKIKKSVLREDDVVIVRTGIPGTCCVVPKEYDGCNCSDIVIVHPDKTKVNPDYLAAYINVWGQKQISNNKVGAIQQHFNVRTAEGMLIALPPLKEQKKIAEIIKNINDKIFLNQRINDNLQQQAEAVYNYWFTQFNFPNENKKPYCASGGQMVWCEQMKCNIPANWTIGNLYTIADFVNGIACQKHRPTQDEVALPVVKIKEMHDGITNVTEFVSPNIPSKNIIYTGDILFSWSATLEVAFWYGAKAGLNQHIFKVVPKKGYSKEYVFQQLSAYVIKFIKMAEARKTTMGHITTDHLHQSIIALPPLNIVDEYTMITKNIFKKATQCAIENQQLIELRNWLLPMLMNGQATIDD